MSSFWSSTVVSYHDSLSSESVEDNWVLSTLKTDQISLQTHLLENAYQQLIDIVLDATRRFDEFDIATGSQLFTL